MKKRLILKIITLSIVFLQLFNSPFILFQTFAQEPLEIISLRTETSKTFKSQNLLGKASYTQISYADKIHFLRNGIWTEIDNNIIKIDPNIYENTANDFIFIINKDLEQGVKYQKGENSCEILLESIDGKTLPQTQVEIRGNKAIYQISENVNLEYTVLSTGIKTEVVITNQNDLPNEILFDVTNCNTTLFDSAIMFDYDNQTEVHQTILETETEKKLLLNPNYETLEEIKGEVRIDPSITSGVVKDTFVSTTTNYGNRRFMAIGNYYDSTVNALFSNSSALIDFNNLTIPENAQLESVSLELYHYGTNANNGELYVSVNTHDWTENEIYPGPEKIGDFGSALFPFYNSNSIAQQRQISLDIEIVKKLQEQEKGISIQNYDPVTSGVVVCSKEIPDGPCMEGMEPKLIITYTLGSTPLIPTLGNPDDNWELGPNEEYDNIICSQTGEGLGCNIGFEFYVEDEAESMPIQAIIELTNNEGEIIENTYTLENSGWFTEYIQITDGKWEWKVKSINKYGNESNWSVSRHFLVDTTKPTTPVIDNEPEFTSSNKNNITLEEYSKDTSNFVLYTFECSLDENFTTILKQGIASFNYYKFTGLANNQTYYYRVKGIDKYGNESDYSDTTFSTQDATQPIPTNINLSQQVISPENEDNHIDYSTFSVNINEPHWKSNQIIIWNSRGVIVLNKEINEQNVKYIIDGKDDNGEWLPDGVYKIEFIARDLAGNYSRIGGLSASSKYDEYFLLIIDNSAGILNISYPENNSWFSEENINLTGITGTNSNITINNKSTNQSYQLIPNENTGIFEQEIVLNEGENNIEVKSVDNYANIITENLIVYRDITQPQINIINPTEIINNPLPIIELNIAEQNTLSSGIDEESFYLSLIDENDNEIVLINESLEISDLGYYESNCSQSNNCFLQYFFTKEIQPDGNYQIKTKVKDLAGNETEEYRSFSLDTKTFINIQNPVDKELFNYSSIEINGSAEMNSTIEVWNNENWVRSLEINPEQEDENIVISNCRLPSVEGDSDFSQEICDFKILNFQLEADFENDQIITNNLLLKVTDNAGNIMIKTTGVDVNLFSVNLSINTDLEYFSPNNDGKQDGINFIDLETDGIVDSWNLTIKDIYGNEIKKFEGEELLPENIYWNGENNLGEIITDGDYKYTLELITTDGISIQTEAKTLYARTYSDDKVIITSPKNESITTKGVSNIYGVAPLNTNIRICIDVIGIDGNCNLEYKTISNNDGYFSLIIPLLRLSENTQTENIISAWAIDKYGNQSEKSNIVSVHVDTIDPFVSVSALPIITGINNEEEYQEFLDKVETDTVTKEDIDSLKTVILRSTVTQNTEWVNFEFADFTNLSELPQNYDYEQIGWIDNENKSYWYSSTPTNTIKSCQTNECTWDFYYPVPPVTGGIYEVVFTGKKAETIEKMSASIIIDGTLPLAPTIIDINATELPDPNTEEYENLNIYNETYYSKYKHLEIIGVSDPNVDITIYDQDNNLICQTETNDLGLFYCAANLEDFYEINDFELNLRAEADDGQNIIGSIENTKMIIDQTSPEIIEKEVQPYYTKGDSTVELKVISNEKIKLAEINNIDYKEELTLSENLLSISGNFYIELNETEGLLQKEITIYDLAGNKTTTTVEVLIDNTSPKSSNIVTDDWGNSGINAIIGIPATNRLGGGYVTNSNVNITGIAENNSTVILYVNGEIIEEFPCQKSSSEENTEWNYLISFEKEGYYSIATKVKDRSGNLSAISESIAIYFDQTPPQSIELLNLEKSTYENSINFDIETERSADLEIQIENPNNEIVFQKIVNNSSTGITNIKTNIGDEIGVYQVQVTAYDSAGNSKKVQLSFMKLEIPKLVEPLLTSTETSPINTNNVLGVFEEQLIKKQQENSNSIQGASLENPWAGQLGSKFSNSTMTVNIKYDGSYNISDFIIPSPILTMIDIPTNTGTIYGSAIPKGQSLSVNYNFYYASFNEAKQICNIANWKSTGLMSKDEKQCIEKNMGIENVNNWYLGQSTICGLIPITSMFCINNKLSNWRQEDTGSIETKAQNVMVSFYKNDSSYIGNIWNDTTDGNFSKEFNFPYTLKEGDSAKAKTTIFGDFEINGIKIDYRGNNGSGLQSKLSNKLTVGESRIIPDFIEPTEVDEICKGTHNENKQYSVAEAAILLSEMLDFRYNSYNEIRYSKFKCKSPYCAYIPQKAKDMYTVSNYWNPTYHKDSYIQCIAFVYMAYNLGGNPIDTTKGNAITMAGKQWNCTSYDNNGDCENWVLGNNSAYTDQFNIYKSGETDVMPQVGDIMIWEQSPPYGHVGVVTYVDETLKYIEITNGNSERTDWTYTYTKDSNWNISIMSTGKWKPDYWARKK